MDNFFFYSINKGCSNRLLDVIMPLLSELGDWKFLLPLAVILLFLRKKEARRLGAVLLIGLFVSYGAVFILKTFIARPRPFLALPDVNLLVREKGFSFPSGHASNAFMAAALLFAYSKKLYYSYVAAAGVAFSRIYLGVHFPSDVIAGALLGTILGYAIARTDKIKSIMERIFG